MLSHPVGMSRSAVAVDIGSAVRTGSGRGHRITTSQSHQIRSNTRRTRAISPIHQPWTLISSPAMRHLFQRPDILSLIKTGYIHMQTSPTPRHRPIAQLLPALLPRHSSVLPSIGHYHPPLLPIAPQTTPLRRPLPQSPHSHLIKPSLHIHGIVRDLILIEAHVGIAKAEGDPFFSYCLEMLVGGGLARRLEGVAIVGVGVPADLDSMGVGVRVEGGAEELGGGGVAVRVRERDVRGVDCPCAPGRGTVTRRGRWVVTHCGRPEMRRSRLRCCIGA